MKPQIILILSLVCNLGLASVAFHYLRSNGSRPNDSAISQSSAKELGKDQSSKSSLVRKMMVTNYNSDEFTWRNVEAQDYKDYIANLRSVDCPEETIRDIIFADVNKLYAGKFKLLRGEEGDYKYWKGNRSWSNNKEGLERQKRIRELEKEKSALLVELLGVDPEKDRQKEMGYSDYRDRNLSFLPEEKKKLARDIQEKFEEQRQELYRNGIYDEEDQKALKKVYEAQMAEMAKVLTPQELEEYDLRASQIASQLRYDLDGFEPTENEFREVYRLRKAREDDLAYSYDPDDKAGQERRKKAGEEVDLQIKAQMGDARYAEYKRSQDYSYKELARLSDRLELPKGTAVAVFDMKKVAEDEVRKVREDKTLTNEQRTQALQAIRMETEKAITESLGESGLKKYRSRGGYWISNLAPTPSKGSVINSISESSGVQTIVIKK